MKNKQEVIVKSRVCESFFKNIYEKFKIQIKTVIILLCFVSCGKTQINLEGETDVKNPTPVLQLSPKEKEEIIANDLFLAVVNNKSIAEIEKILSSTSLSLNSVNKREDTILGVAIQFKHEDLAFSLLQKYQCKDLSHRNKKGESYIYLSAKYGYVKLIHSIAGKCYENDMFDFKDYEFSDLDPETENGEIAIHAALNGSIAEALKYEYRKGTFEYLWFTFYKKNKIGETFLHTAIKDNRINTVEWAIRAYCEEDGWEKSDSDWKQVPASIWNKSWNWLQTHVVNVDQLVNEQDVEENTALHLATQFLNIPIIRLLSSCRWMDFLIENKEGNIAFQVFLLALDPTVRNHNEAIKDTFVFLVHKETYLKEWISNVSKTVDHQNQQEDSSLHIAARLADPYFYNYLKKYGDLALKNENGITPEEIFKSTRSKIDGM